MPKKCYIEKTFKPASVLIIQQANEIIDEYRADGMSLTLRQLYYQFVSRDLIKNKQTEYKRLGAIISDARLAGLIDWSAIEDRTRNIQGNQHWKDPGQIVRAAARSFMLDRWAGQEYRVEVWIEKEALVGVIAEICERLDVPYFACKGYVSQSELWRASQRLYRYYADGQQPVIIHLGDHDPSGIDMTRDIGDRADIFTYVDEDDKDLRVIEVKRIALNMDQVVEYNPPPNPAKLTDTRSDGYIDKYGVSSWELDALEPRVLRNLIRETVEGYRDDDVYAEVISQEKKYLDVLKNVEENWETL